MHALSAREQKEVKGILLCLDAVKSVGCHIGRLP